MTQAAIEAERLRKAYGATTVLDGVDLDVGPGTVFALLGPNGAGKTTMVRILATLTKPDAGHARVAGYDVVTARSRVRRHISLTGQYVAIDDLQTGAENLRMLGRLAGLTRAQARRRADELLDDFGLTQAARKRVGAYSGGMRRRLDLAASLVTRPTVLFLDEPTTGLDPRSRQAVWRTVKELASSGVTVFLTTQYLDEADTLADHIALLDAGRVVVSGTPGELKHRVTARRLDLTTVDDDAREAVARRLGTRVIHQDGLVLGVATDGAAGPIRVLLDEVDPQRDLIARFAVHEATLDDVFLALTGHPATMPKETVDV